MASGALHADGTKCREGTRNVPSGFAACCAQFDRATHACVNDIRFEWWPNRHRWYVMLANGGTSGLELNFCPFCGSRLANKKK